jgi:hypothetical protein
MKLMHILKLLPWLVEESRSKSGCRISFIGAVIGGGLVLSSGFILLLYAEVMGKSDWGQAPLLGFFLLPFGVIGGAIVAHITYDIIGMLRRKPENAHSED